MKEVLYVPLLIMEEERRELGVFVFIGWKSQQRLKFWYIFVLVQNPVVLGWMAKIF